MFTAVLYFVRFSNDSAIIDQIIKALNADDLAEIQRWLGYEFTWTPALIKEFQEAIETAKYEREFCLEEGVSNNNVDSLNLCIHSYFLCACT